MCNVQRRRRRGGVMVVLVKPNANTYFSGMLLSELETLWSF